MKRQRKKELMEKKATFLRQAKEFRTYGKILCIHGETFHDKLNGAIAVELAEVCELLAQTCEK